MYACTYVTLIIINTLVKNCSKKKMGAAESKANCKVVPLLSVTKSSDTSETVVVQKEGVAAIEKWMHDKCAQPLNAVVILGAARSGKSFLMNCLMSCDCFQVRGGTPRCTVGALIPDAILSLQEFKEGKAPGNGATEGDRSHPLVAFVDVEGSQQGVTQGGHGFILEVPLLLVSKVAILNWPGLPTAQSLQTHCALLVNAAMALSPNCRSKVFGDLIIVCRECKQSSESVYSVLFNEENEADATSIEEGVEMRARNNMRQTLQNSFDTIQVSCLPKCHDHLQTRIRGASISFHGAVGSLRDKMATALQAPMKFGGVNITTPIFKAVLPAIVAAVNEGATDIDPRNILLSQHSKIVEFISAELEAGFVRFRNSLAWAEAAGGLPRDAATFAMEGKINATMREFDDIVTNLQCAADIIDPAKKMLRQALDTAVVPFQKLVKEYRKVRAIMEIAKAIRDDINNLKSFF